MAPAILTNGWFIAACGFLAAEVVVPLVRALANAVYSYRGAFSGQYLCLSQYPDGYRVFIEIADCRHIREKVKGRIEAVAIADLRHSPPGVSLRTGSYSFEGFVAQRTLLVHYQAEQRRARSVGLLVLHANDSGDVFSGQWAGTIEEKIEGESCTWLQMKRRVVTESQRQEIVALALKEIQHRKELATNAPDLIPSSKGSGTLEEESIKARRAELLTDLNVSTKGTQSYGVE